METAVTPPMVPPVPTASMNEIDITATDADSRDDGQHTVLIESPEPGLPLLPPRTPGLSSSNRAAVAAVAAFGQAGPRGAQERLRRASILKTQFRDEGMRLAEEAFQRGDFAEARQVLMDIQTAEQITAEAIKEEEEQLELDLTTQPPRMLHMQRVHIIRELRKRSSYYHSLVLYLVYCLSLLYLTLFVFPQSTTMMRQREAIEDVLLDEEFSGPNASYTDLVFKKNFDDVRTVDEFWQFMYGPLVAAIWRDEGGTGHQPGLILMNSFLIGAIQVRQVRIRNVSCDAMAVDERRVFPDPSSLPDAPAACYPRMSILEPTSRLTLDSYGDRLTGVPCVNGTESCLYHHSWHTSPVRGSVGLATSTGATQRYGHGGFVVELSRDLQIARTQIAQMEQTYIDRSTRVVAVSFNVYNPSEDIFVIVQLTFEFGATGHVEPYARIAPIRLMRDFFFTNRPAERILFVVVCALALFFLALEIQSFIKHPMVYFSDRWNIYELVDLWCFYSVIHTMSSFQQLSAEVAEQLHTPQQVNHYFDAMESGGMRSTYRKLKMWVALNAFTAVLKIFKFTQISRKMNSLWEVLQRALKELVAFSCILLFILMAYATAGCVLFGDHIRRFHNIPSSMHTLLYFTIGDFDVDYDKLRQASSMWAPWFIMTYLVLVALVSVNMFIAILSDAYDVYSQEKKKQTLDRRDSKSGNEVSSIFSFGKRLHEIIDKTKPTWQLRVQTVVAHTAESALHTQHPRRDREVREEDRDARNSGNLDENDDGLDLATRQVCIKINDTVRLQIGRSYLDSDKREIYSDEVVGNTTSALLNGVRLLARFTSLDTDKKQTSPHASQSRRTGAWQSTIVFGLLSRRVYQARGQIMPGRSVTRMLESLHAGEQLWIKDNENFLGNEIKLTYRPADGTDSTTEGIESTASTSSDGGTLSIDTPVQDLMTGRVVNRHDTYADFTVHDVFTLESQTENHGLSCWVDPNIAILVIPYPLYGKLLLRCFWKWLREDSCSDLCRMFGKWIVNPCLHVRQSYLKTFRGQERVADLVEQYLDGKLRHVAAHKHDARFKQKFDDTWYDQEKRAFAAMDVTLADLPRQVRQFNQRQLTPKTRKKKMTRRASRQSTTSRPPACMICTHYRHAVRAGMDDLTLRTLAYLDGTMEDDEATHPTTYKAVRNHVDQYLKTTYGGAVTALDHNEHSSRRLKVAGTVAATVARCAADGLGASNGDQQ